MLGESPWAILLDTRFSFEYILVSSVEQSTSSCLSAVQSHVQVHLFTAGMHQDPSVMDKN